MSRFFAVLILLLICCAVATAQQTTTSPIAASSPIFKSSPIATSSPIPNTSLTLPIEMRGNAELAPYEFNDEHGLPQGFDIDLALAIGRVEGLTPKIKLGDFSGMISELQRGRIHALIGVVYTAERAKQIDYSMPYLTVAQSVFIRRGEKRLSSVQDLNGKEVIVQKSGILHDFLIRNYPKAIPITVSKPVDGLRLLAAGKHDCMLLGRYMGISLRIKYKLDNVTSWGPPIMESKMCLAVRKGDKDLLSKINEGLSILSTNGTLQKNYDKWLGVLEPKPTSTKIFHIIAIVSSILLVLLCVVVFWTWSLRKQVEQRTQALKDELAERRRAEEALRQSEQRYRTLVDNIDFGILGIGTDYRVHSCNETLCRHFWPQEQMAGQRCYEIFEKRNTPCQDCPGEIVLRTGQPADIESERHTKEGKAFPVRLRAFPIFGADGQPAGFIELVEDISIRKQAEARDKQHAREVATLLNSLPAYAYLKDANSVYVTVNRMFADAVGMSQAEIPGKTDRDLFPQEFAEQSIGNDRKVLSGGEVLETEIEAPLGRDHNPKVVLLSRKVPIKGEDGSYVGLIGLDFDITERRHTEEERRRLDAQIQHTQKLESLGILAGGIAHDFNNLLMGILGNAEIALSSMPMNLPAASRIEELKRAALRASDLTKQMLAYSGRGKFLIEALNLNELIEEMANLLHVSISKKISIKYRFTENLPAVKGDASQIRQVIMNLITNASDAIGDRNGLITLATGVMQLDRSYIAQTYLQDGLKEGHYVFIEVSDTGCGMDAATRARIFDPFFTTKFTGRGLGLAAVLGIIRGHHGTIKIYSEPGKGTMFKVLFPFSDDPIGYSESPAAKAARTANWTGSGTILVVDDEEMVRDVAQMMLESFGFTVLTAKDGSEGLAVVQEGHKIDAVLLDLTMPKMSGEETFREMHRLRPQMPIILVSGYNEQEVTEQFIGKGISGFIQKPFQLAELMAKLRGVLEK